MSRYYGAFLKLEGRRCLVVGGGPVAERKIAGLLECGADVTVIAPSLTRSLVKLAENGTIRWEARPYRAGDAEPFFLIIAATDSKKINRQVDLEAGKFGRLVNVVNDQEAGNFVVPATVRRGMLTVAISTAGAAPVIAKKFREELEAFFGPEYELFLELMSSVRKRLLAEVPDERRRSDLLRRLANSDLLQLLREGKQEEAEQLIQRITGGRAG
jgi:precorrin-2 dehydrogenase/sirohydrochlorin ferrochelatase